MAYPEVLFGLGLALLVLLGWLLVQRRAEPAEARWGGPSGGRWAWGLAALLTLVASAPLLVIAPALLRSDVLLSGDASTHLAAALGLADHGLKSAWLAHTHAGFPAFVHYPVVAWLPVIALVKVGVSPITSVQAVGLGALLLGPLLALLATRRAGASPAASALGAVALGVVAPISSFLGGWESYLSFGLLAQVFGVVATLLVIVTLMPSSPRWQAPLAGALLAATHPQVAVAAFCLLGGSVLVAESSQAALRYRLAALAGLLMAVALFGPGMVSMEVPFGWPGMDRWKLVGRPASYWYEQVRVGEVLDRDRVPVLQTAGAMALAFCLASLGRRAARVASVGAVGALGLLLAGPWVDRLGRLGAALLAALQPMRVAALLPVALVLLLVVSTHELEASLRGWARGGARRVLAEGLAEGLAWLPVVLLLGLALPARAVYAREEARVRAGAEWSRTCGGQVPGIAFRQVSQWLRARGVGRLAEGRASEGSVAACLIGRPFVDGTPRISFCNGGVGAHVGVMSAAFAALAPGEPGAARRAEALGIRYVVRFGTEPALNPDDWEVVGRDSALSLARRRRGGDLFGAACVRQVWEASNGVLKEALLADLVGPSLTLQTPEAPIEVRTGSGALRTSTLPAQGCDARAATIEELPAEPGHHAALVTSGAPVDLVLRVTAFPTWRLRVDGVDVPWRKVAPGFPAVRLGPGRHRVVADVSLPRGYVAGVLAALCVVVALALGERPWRALAALRQRRRRRAPGPGGRGPS